jgi:hypothetical protein
MKQFLTLFMTALVSFSVLQAQSLMVSNYDQVVTYDPSGFSATAHATIVNTTGSDIAVKALRSSNNVTGSAASYFCWDVCYGATTNESIGAINVRAGDSTKALSLYFEPNGETGTHSVTMRFFDRDSSTDYVDVTFTFEEVSATALEDNFDRLNALSAPYPNPASTYANIRVALPFGTKDASIQVFNLVGREVQRINLTSPSEEVRINTERFNPGVYFVYLTAEGQQITSRKLVVRK